MANKNMTLGNASNNVDLNVVGNIKQNSKPVVLSVNNTEADNNGNVLLQLPAASTTVAGITTIGVDGGAAYFSHTHNYAGSSEPGGAANSVKSSLTIYKDTTLLGTFNGSAALSITFKPMTSDEVQAMFN